MGMLKEFKDFAVRGNLVDIAVAFVMGGAFGKVVSSFTEGLIAPLVGLLTGGVDFNKMEATIKKGVAETKDAAGNVVAAQPAITLKYGAFITTVIDFIIVAFVMFLVIKALNSIKKKEEAAPAAPAPTPEDITLLREIRDALKK